MGILPLSIVFNTFSYSEINENRVGSVDDFIEELKKSENGKILLEGFYENYPGEYYYTFAMK